MMYDVRMAVPEDEDGIVRMITMLHDENGLFPLSEKRVREYINRFFRKEGALIGAVGEPGDPIGSIYLGIEQPYYSETWYLNEAWNFVDPEFRHFNYGKRLISWAKDVAKSMNLPLMVGIVSNHRTEAKIRLYKRQLEEAGAFFVWNREASGPSAWDRDDR